MYHIISNALHIGRNGNQIKTVLTIFKMNCVQTDIEHSLFVHMGYTPLFVHMDYTSLFVPSDYLDVCI